MPFLVTSDVIQSVEDVHPVLEGVVLSASQPFGIDHLQHLRAVLLFPLACVPDDPPPGDGTDLLAKAKQGVNGCLEATAAVPSEDELIAVDVDVLFPKAVVRPHRPAFEVGEDAMNPLQHDMGWQRVLGAEVMRLVFPLGRPFVCAVAVGACLARCCS